VNLRKKAGFAVLGFEQLKLVRLDSEFEHGIHFA